MSKIKKIGVPSGGSTGQVLSKQSATDYDLEWATPSGGPGGSAHTIQNEGTPLTSRTNLNFVGQGVSVTDDSVNDATIVTVGDFISSSTNTSLLANISITRTNGNESGVVEIGHQEVLLGALDAGPLIGAIRVTPTLIEFSFNSIAKATIDSDGLKINSGLVMSMAQQRRMTRR